MIVISFMHIGPCWNLFAYTAKVPRWQFDGVINIEQAARIAPHRIQIVGNAVHLYGPFAFVSSKIGILFGKIISSMFFAYIVFNISKDLINRITQNPTEEEKTSGNYTENFQILGVISGIAFYFLLNQYIPTRPGLYFRDCRFLGKA